MWWQITSAATTPQSIQSARRARLGENDSDNHSLETMGPAEAGVGKHVRANDVAVCSMYSPTRQCMHGSPSAGTTSCATVGEQISRMTSHNHCG